MEKILTREELKKKIDRCRSKGRKVVFTNGCFDIIHAGHTHYLAEARALGDLLVLALNSDASVRAIKGEKRPLVPENERAAVAAALGCVDYVVIFGETTRRRLSTSCGRTCLSKAGTGRKRTSSAGSPLCPGAEKSL